MTNITLTTHFCCTVSYFKCHFPETNSNINNVSTFSKYLTVIVNRKICKKKKLIYKLFVQIHLADSETPIVFKKIFKQLLLFSLLCPLVSFPNHLFSKLK